MTTVIVSKVVSERRTGHEIATLEFSRVPITCERDYSCSAPGEVPKEMIDQISDRLAAGEICTKEIPSLSPGELYWKLQRTRHLFSCRRKV